MKTAFPCLAGLAALTLAVAVVPPPVAASPPGDLPARDFDSPYAHTAIGAVLDANGGKIPATGRELTAALDKLGDFVQLPVTFSAVALNSGLAHPRVVITMRPSSHPAPLPTFFPDGRRQSRSGGWGSPSAPTGETRLVAGTPALLGAADRSKPYLEGRLYLAANTEVDDRGRPAVKAVEFISWNGRRQKFDFGVIEGMGGTPEVKMLDGVRCFSCHKNRGPILGVAPWSNTAQNDLVRSTLTPRLPFAFRLDRDGNEDEKLGRRDDVDGLRLLAPNGPEVDAAVRRGADVLRDRERFRILPRTPDGRRALVLLLGGIATRGQLDATDRKLKVDLIGLDLVAFLRDAHAANKTAPPSTLADFSPAGAANKPLPLNASGQTNPVTQYDAARAAGNHGLPSEYQPSNPRAFVRPTAPAPTNASQLVSAVALARAIGLSEDDRTFLARTLDGARQRLDDPVPSSAELARTVFTGPSFADVLKTGVLPERDDFKDRFVAGVVEVLRTRQKADRFWQPRTWYASTPKIDPSAAPEPDIAVVPSHACLACHDIRTGAQPAAFNPIPALAFDPFDATARDAWLKTADRKKKADVLGRLAKRLGADKDMPPADSTEAEMYRTKDPVALNAVKDWIDAELKKVK